MKPPSKTLGRPSGRPHAAPARPHSPREAGHEAAASGGRDFTARPTRDAAAPRTHTPSGAIWIYGLHPVAAALANPQRRLRRLLLTEEAEAALAAQLPPPWPQVHERMDRARLDQLLGRDVVHQGMAVLADPLPQPALAALLEKPGPLLVLDQVTDPRNVGAILRSAAAFGVAGVIVQDRHAPEETARWPGPPPAHWRRCR